jgi:hypothetical protein
VHVSTRAAIEANDAFIAKLERFGLTIDQTSVDRLPAQVGIHEEAATPAVIEATINANDQLERIAQGN